jgi:predicted DNA-binding antitoxin AbrB/MazE fold protein
MQERIDATFENGVFKPNEPVHVSEGQRVSLRIEFVSADADDLSETQDLLDSDLADSCHQNGETPSLEEARNALKHIRESLSDRISEERDER